MSAAEHLIARLRITCGYYAAVRIVRDELMRIGTSAASQPVKAPRFAYRMTLIDRVRRA